MTPKPNHDEQTERVEAFESWWQSTVTDKFIPWTGPEHKGFAAGYQAGKRDGAKEQKQRDLKVVDGVRAVGGWTSDEYAAKFTGGSWGGACDVIAARISEENVSEEKKSDGPD